MTTLDGSVLALGSCIAGTGILMSGLLALLFRHPDAPRWTRPDIAAMLLCVPVAAAIGLGLGYTIYGLWQLANGAGDPRGLLVLAAVLIALVLLWRGLQIRQRLRNYALPLDPGSPSEPLEAARRATGATAPPDRATQGPTAGLPGSPA